MPRFLGCKFRQPNVPHLKIKKDKNMKKIPSPQPTVVALVCAAVVLLFTIPAQAQPQPLLTRHVRDAVANGQAQLIGKLPSTQTLRFDMVVPLRDRAGLQNFVQEVQDPQSPSYHQFLTPHEFTARFGPSQQDWNALVAFAKANGFEIISGTRDARDLRLSGTVADIEKAFHVTMGQYKDLAEDRTFVAVDREPTVDLPFQIWHITGLDNDSRPHPMYVKKSDYAKANGLDPDKVVSHATTGSGPSASFLGSDMRAAYYGGTALTGTGQNIALFEFAGTDLSDLSTYYKNVGQTEPYTPTLISTGGYGTSCVDSGGSACDDTEQTLDMTQAMGMAPGSTMLYMYVCGDVLASGSGNISDTSCISAMVSDADAPLSKQISCSWGWTPADSSTLDPYFEQMASQGQNFFAASGDSSAWSASNEAWPADDANIVSVGGTDLTTSSAAGPWKSETAWADSGGGISPDSIPIPSWQQLAGVITSKNEGSTTLRNGPDVSANANFTFYVCADQTTCTANDYGGTSFATPMWAGYIALLNQQLVADGQPTIGFIDPTIYAENITSDYATDFHDITSGTSGSYSAVTGYDLVTGWGSPNGTGLINALAPTSQTPAFTLAASPTSVSVVVGNSGSSTITTAVSGGFDSPVALTASGQPTGVTVSFSPGSIAAPGSGTSTATLAVASTTTTGTYTVTITGTGGGITHTATIALTVTAAATPAFTLAASPASVSVVQGSSGSSTLTTAVSGGFDSAVALTASGQPTGVTATFSPTSIAAPGSGTSKLTLAVASTTTAGTYTITVTGTGGGITHTATVSLTVTAATAGTYTISVSPTSGYLDQGQSGYAVVTVTGSGGFDSKVALSATGIPSGVTGSFSPTSITGSGTSDFTLSVARNAPAGTYPITITGTSGGTSHSTTLTFEVVSRRDRN